MGDRQEEIIVSFSWFSERKVLIFISWIKFMTENYVFSVRCYPKFYVLFMRTSAGTCCETVLAVNHRSLTTENRVQSQFSPCNICGGKCSTGWDFSPGTAIFLLSLSFHQCSTFISIYSLLLPEGQTGEAWEPSKKQFSSRKPRSLGQKCTFTYSSVTVFGCVENDNKWTWKS